MKYYIQILYTDLVKHGCKVYYKGNILYWSKSFLTNCYTYECAVRDSDIEVYKFIHKYYNPNLRR